MEGVIQGPLLSQIIEDFPISDVVESDIFPNLACNTHRSQKDISTGKFDKSVGLVEITKAKGSAWRSIGGNIAGKLYLFPEEALFLFECNKLVIHGEVAELTNESIWNILCPDKHSFNQYLVYAQLKRMGYFVVRHGAYKSTHHNIYIEHLHIINCEEQKYITPVKRSKLDCQEGKCGNYEFPSPSFDLYRPGDYFMKSALLQPDYSITVVASSEPFPSKEILLKLKLFSNLLLALVTECTVNIYSVASGPESI